MEKMRDIVIFVGAGLLVGVAWWHFYVMPHDAMRHAVVDCMIENRIGALPSEISDDRETYDRCMKDLRPGG
jgi:hypothetical protein